ncbi:MAG: YfbK domain-containing protein, partial [Pseudomonadales bacterium]|nr:YfbK domain-containing protein [Pseudomonadales bacterium]
ADRDEPAALSDELAHVRVRWLAPRSGDGEGGRIERALTVDDVLPNLDRASDDLRFAAAVAGLGELLRGGRHAGTLDYAAVTALARDGRGPDPDGERGAFLGLVRLAEAQDAGRVALRD